MKNQYKSNVMNTVLTQNTKTRFKRGVLSALAFAYCGASFYAAASLSTPVDPLNTAEEVIEQTVSLSWEAIAGADGYRLEEENEAGQFVEVATDIALTQSVERTPGTYRYRVIGCINDNNDELLCNEDIASYSSIATVPVGSTPVPPAVIETAPTPELQVIAPQDSTSATIGVMAGEFRVDESGAANYSVPIALPEGIAGVTPELGMVYNSASGNGPLGIGWSISGLSSISRCRQTIEQDGQTRPLTLTNEDRFCLDGQRLISIDDAQDYGDDTTEYRTEIDSKARVISYGNEAGGPAYFVVEREDGSMSYYGNMSADPTDEATDAIHTADTGEVLTWYLSSISDNVGRTGNSIYFDYNNGVEGFGENEITIDQIRYSDNTVKFNYTNNTTTDDIRRSGYMHGNMFELKALLDDVVVTNHDEIVLRTYKVTYGQDAESDISRITAIQECGLGGLCMAPTVFDWNTVKPLTHGVRQTGISLGRDTIRSPLPIDLDNDGFSDFVYVSDIGSDRFQVKVLRNNGFGGLNTAAESLFTFENDDEIEHPVRLIPADIDGDGNIEFAYYSSNLSGQLTWYYYDLDDEESTSLNLTVSASDDFLLFHDVDSDAYPDILYHHENSGLSGSRIMLNDRRGNFGTPKQVPISVPPVGDVYSTVNTDLKCFSHGTTVSPRAEDISPYDVNNDGVADIVLRLLDIFDNRAPGCGFREYWASFELVESSPGNYQYDFISEVGSTRVGFKATMQIGDLNDDGLGDTILPIDNEVELFLSTGDGTGVSQHVTIEAEDDDVELFQVTDVNRDNRADMLYFDTSTKTWEVKYQNRDGTFTVADTLITDRDYDEDTSSIFPVDWTGDGSTGFAHVDFSSRELYIWRDTIQDTTVPNQVIISDITNSFGVETNIDYRLMTRPPVYKRGDLADSMSYGNGSPVFDLISPSYLVSRVDSSAPGYVNGSYQENNKLTVNYFYEGLRAQSGGRGSLGFEKVYTYDPQRNVTTETTYRQDFPFTGMPEMTQQYIGQRTATPGADKILNLALNELDSFTFHGGKTVYPYIEKSTETMYALNDAATATKKKSVVETTNTYTKVGDNYLNMTGSVVVTKDAGNTERSRVTTSNIFGADNVDNWWLGRLTSTTVTHSRPGTPEIVRESEFTYNAKGMLDTETVAPKGDVNLKLVTKHCYDYNDDLNEGYGNKITTITGNEDSESSPISCDKPASITDVEPTDAFRFSGMTYDDFGRYETSSQSSLSEDLINVSSRNAFGQATTTEDINGVTVKSEFDAFARPYATSNSLGQTSHTTRALAENGATLGAPVIDEDGVYLIEKTVASGSPTTYQYTDRLGRVLAQATEGFEDDSYIVQISRYDEFSNVLEQSNPYYMGDNTPHFSVTTYDKFNRPQSTTAADGVTVTATVYAADGLGTTTTVTSNHGVNQTQIERMNVLGERTKVTDAAGSDTLYGYDATGNLVRVENEGVGATKSVITTTFDDYGRKMAMSDPDKGDWSYVYNALGEMISQTDAKNQTMAYFRDSEGRTVKRTDHSGRTTYYEYGKTTHPQLMTAECISTGDSCSDGEVEYAKNYLYDAFSRVDTVLTTIGSDIYMERTTYDEFGRVFQTFDATGDDYGIRQHYNSRGYPTKQEEARYSGSTDASLKKVYYEVTAMDAFGNVTEMHQNDGLIVGTGAYDLETGFATSMQASANNVLIQDNSYTFDGIGNLRTRNRGALKSTASVQVNGQSLDIHHEAFGYDDLNRMTHINSTEKVRYMANGNISWKSDVGYYCYEASRPHAISGIGSAANCSSTDYKYDNNGNMTSGRGRTINYSDFDKPTRISNNKGTTLFDYDTGRSRYKRNTSENGEATVMYYIGNVEVVLKGAAANDVSYTETRRYLPGAIQTQTAGGIKNQYLTKDHLGSIDSILDDSGKLIEKLYFDAWGKKVSLDKSLWSTAAANQAATSLVNILDITPRGFTGHEHVDHADIIHMNGRIYDPTLGRFLQADPHIQAPVNSQSYNRYSYLANNPLSGTDPTGFIGNFFRKVIGAVTNGIIGELIASIIPQARILIQAAACFYAGPLGCAASSFGNTLASGGSLKGAFTSAAFSYASAQFAGIDTGNIGTNILVQGTVGGIISDLSGGKFGHGFVSAGLGAAIGGRLQTKSAFANVVISGAIGGTISQITGGKFANGAASAAFTQALSEDWRSGTQYSDENGSYVTDDIADNSNHTEITIGDNKKSVTLMVSNELDTVITALQAENSQFGDSILGEFGNGNHSVTVNADYGIKYAGTHKRGVITLNPNAYHGHHAGSAQLILGHELIHFRDYLNLGRRIDRQRAFTESNAHKWELNNTNRFIADDFFRGAYERNVKSNLKRY